MALLLSDNIQAKKIIRDKEEHVITKEPIHQDNVTVLMCMSQIIRAAKYIKYNYQNWFDT